MASRSLSPTEESLKLIKRKEVKNIFDFFIKEMATSNAYILIYSADRSGEAFINEPKVVTETLTLTPSQLSGIATWIKIFYDGNFESMVVLNYRSRPIDCDSLYADMTDWKEFSSESRIDLDIERAVKEFDEERQNILEIRNAEYKGDQFRLVFPNDIGVLQGMNMAAERLGALAVETHSHFIKWEGKKAKFNTKWRQSNIPLP